MSKVKISRAFKLPFNITVRGATAPNGIPYVRVAASGRHAWIQRGGFSGSGSAALRLLAAQNIPLLASEWTQCRAQVAKLDSYPVTPLIDKPGWNGEHFALPDGTVFSPTAEGKPVVLFPVSTQKCAAAGTLVTWQKLSSLLQDQHLASFVVFAAFAAPLLALTDGVLNFGFELVGPGGVGKSTLQRVAAAVCGPADNPLGPNYWISADATINGLERAMIEHRDMPLILEELNLYAAGESDTVRARKLRELAFKLANRTDKLRYGESVPQNSPLVYITSANEPLAELLAGKHMPVAGSAIDRLMTIPIGADRQYGIFDFLPPGFPNSGKLAEHLSREICKCYGVAIRQFLEHLVIERAKNPEAFAKKIRSSIEFFRRKVKVDANDGSETRVADAHGLVYAGARLAVRYGAISKDLDPLEAALETYKLSQSARAKPENLARKLRGFLDRTLDDLEVDPHNLKDLSDSEIDAADVIVRKFRNGRRELLFTEAQLKRAFSNTRALFADPEVQAMMITEKGRKQTKRQIRLNKGLERFHVFILPASE